MSNSPHAALMRRGGRDGLFRFGGGVAGGGGHLADGVADEDRRQAAGDGLQTLEGLVQADHADAADDHRHAGPEAFRAERGQVHGRFSFVVEKMGEWGGAWNFSRADGHGRTRTRMDAHGRGRIR